MCWLCWIHMVLLRFVIQGLIGCCFRVVAMQPLQVLHPRVAMHIEPFDPKYAQLTYSFLLMLTLLGWFVDCCLQTPGLTSSSWGHSPCACFLEWWLRLALTWFCARFLSWRIVRGVFWPWLPFKKTTTTAASPLCICWSSWCDLDLQGCAKKKSKWLRGL